LTVLFDWFTVVAQIINFLILVFLLKRFLYKPIIRVMSEREQKITSRLEQAQQKKQEAEQEAKSYRQKISEFDNSRRQMLEKAQEEVEAWREEKFNEARIEAEAVQERWQQAIQQDYEALLNHIRQQTTEQVLAIARRALVDLANTDLEKQIAATFIEHLKLLDGDALVALKEAVKNTKQGIVVTSAFNLPPDLKQNIKSSIDQWIDTGIKIVFERSPDVIGGIELRVSGHKVAWSLNNYLEILDDSMTEIFLDQVQVIE
jgi:F-type H+-transporting ATPase subunit b